MSRSFKLRLFALLIYLTALLVGVMVAVIRQDLASFQPIIMALANIVRLWDELSREAVTREGK